MELRRVAFAALLLGGALLLGTSCDDNSTTSVHVRRCTIVVETFPVQLAAPWRLTSPDSTLRAGSGSCDPPTGPLRSCGLQPFGSGVIAATFWAFPPSPSQL